MTPRDWTVIALGFVVLFARTEPKGKIAKVFNVAVVLSWLAVGIHGGLF